MENNVPKKTILLHCCCAPCASSCIERLQNAGREVILFFSNSNISPYEEYEKRLDAMRRLAEICRVRLIEDGYMHDAWRTAATGYESEPERGRRCVLCFNFSLGRTAAMAEKLGGIPFTTSLTVSPHKNSELIFQTGRHYSGFEEHNFKKQDGFKRSRELTGQYGLYSQNYCGCEFSMRQA